MKCVLFAPLDVLNKLICSRRNPLKPLSLAGGLATAAARKHSVSMFSIVKPTMLHYGDLIKAEFFSTVLREMGWF